ncbi:hypothetical protein ACPCK2_18235 [Streptomyces pseudogriseolus]
MVAHRPVVAVMAGTLTPSGVHRWIGRGHRHPQAAFVKAWRRRYKAAPDPYAAEAYDSVRMLLSEFARTVPARGGRRPARAALGARMAKATYGPVVGSPGDLSPEQARGRTVGPASDVFSLGCVLAHAATGRAVFGTGGAAAVLYLTVHEPPDPDGVPPGLAPIVRRCLEKEPERRP